MIFRDRLYLILAGIFIASLVSCNLIFLKFFEWASIGGESLVVSVGILPYPVTFLVTDILSELYGKRKADAVVISGFVASIFIVGVVIVANSIEAVSWSPVDNATFDEGADDWTAMGSAPMQAAPAMMMQQQDEGNALDDFAEALPVSAPAVTI